MLEKRKHISRIITPILFMVLELLAILMIVNNSDIQKSNLVRSIRGLQANIWEKTEKLTSYFHLSEENERLNRKLAHVLHENDRLRYINERMCKDTAFSDSTGRYTYIPAKIIKQVISNRTNYFVIDKGSRDGLETDMGIITSDGAVGVINIVEENISCAISVLSSQISISAKTKGNSTFGILSWDGKSITHAEMTEIPHHIDIRPGDTIVTSGYSSLFPPEIPLATVEEVWLEKTGFKTVRARYCEDFRSIYNVLVVRDNLAVQTADIEKKMR